MTGSSNGDHAELGMDTTDSAFDVVAKEDKGTKMNWKSIWIGWMQCDCADSVIRFMLTVIYRLQEYILNFLYRN